MASFEIRNPEFFYILRQNIIVLSVSQTFTFGEEGAGR
jgi:hypothetical protein